MARANLVIQEELKAAFLGAHESKTRWLKAELDDVNFVLKAQGPVSGDALVDLETLKAGVLKDSGPCYVMFCISPGADKGAWCLIAFVPDTSKVRARMLYASGQDDVKRVLGHSNFCNSLHATEVDDLTLDALQGNARSRYENAPLTEEELIAKEEVAHMAPPTEARANAMGLVPFKFDEDVDQRLRAFISGQGNLIELEIKGDEQVALGSSDATSLSKSSICSTDPRFYITKLASSGKIYFVFSCPEGTKIKTRMVYSTAKQTVAHHLAELGVNVDKVFEVGDPNDIEDMLKLHDAEDDSAGKIVHQANTRPARPGRRGKARLVAKPK